MKRYLGVGLHRTQFVVCTRWENGEQEIRQSWIGDLAKFVEQLRQEDQMAVEAMGTTARFYDAVVGRVARVVVVNPHQFKGDQRVSEEDGSQRCRNAGVVSGERLVAGGKDEAETEIGS
jgi:hypothetical protein